MEDRVNYNFGPHLQNAKISIENVFQNLFQHMTTKLNPLNESQHSTSNQYVSQKDLETKKSYNWVKEFNFDA